LVFNDATSSIQTQLNSKVSSVGGTLPIVSSGGTSPSISINAATQSLPGSMSALDKTKLDGVATGATVGADWNSNVSNKPTLGTASTKNVPSTGDASITEVVYGTDTRLTNARTPSSHASSHVTGGSDVIANAIAGGNSGLMSGSDKTKLDGIATGAEVNVNAD